jgi:hypothetical protein
MKNKEVEDFLISASQYCSMIENFESYNENNKIRNLLISLLDMYAKAFGIPEVEPQDDKVSTLDISVPKVNFGQFDYYWEVFDPYHLEEPVSGILTDDIVDIYKDVKEGILLYERNKQVEAVWLWRFKFETHWGSHAVDAIRALHSAKNDAIH